MKASELQALLSKMIAEHGDLPVAFLDDDCVHRPIVEVVMVDINTPRTKQSASNPWREGGFTADIFFEVK